MIEKITRIDQKGKIHCVLLSHEFLSTNIYYTSIYIFYYYSFQDNFKNPKNNVNPTSASGDTHKTIFIILFFIGDSFKFKVTQETRLI